jgi:hypothetical protein
LAKHFGVLEVKVVIRLRNGGKEAGGKRSVVRLEFNAEAAEVAECHRVILTPPLPAPAGRGRKNRVLLPPSSGSWSNFLFFKRFPVILVRSTGHCRPARFDFVNGRRTHPKF